MAYGNIPCRVLRRRVDFWIRDRVPRRVDNAASFQQSNLAAGYRFRHVFPRVLRVVFKQMIYNAKNVQCRIRNSSFESYLQPVAEEHT